MYVSDIIKRLQINAVRVGRLDYYNADTVNDILETLATECVRWSTEDFKHQAIMATSAEEWDLYYNKDMFQPALEEMIRKHDASVGITWDTIDYYLETYCSKKEYKPYDK